MRICSHFLIKSLIKNLFLCSALTCLSWTKRQTARRVKRLRYHYTAEEKVTSFLTFLEIFWFLLYYFYIYHHIRCDTTGKVAREVAEIGPWRCFSYLCYWCWRVDSRYVKWRLERTRTVLTWYAFWYLLWFGFLTQNV